MTLVGKKRKLDGADCAPNSQNTVVSQEPCDVSRMLRDVYENLDKFGDVTVLVKPTNDEKAEAVKFRCSGAILASSSDVFKAMLFGEMANPLASPNRAPDNRLLELQYCSPECFELMLRFIHGEDIKLDVCTATDLYAFADYYGVLSLCNTCIDYLQKSVHVMNVSASLFRARASHCSAVEKICMSILTLEFGRVVGFDANFTKIEPEILQEIVQRDDLGCSGERNLVDALFKWHSNVEERDSWLLKMLEHVRWVNVTPKECENILLDKRLRDVEGAEAHVKQLIAKRHGLACSRKTWGFLVAHNPAEPHHDYFENVAPFPHNRDDKKVFYLDSNCDIVIGRSRSTDIRVGHKQTAPYVSSKHFSIHFVFDHAREKPGAQAVLKDMSQNGTFVNGHNVGATNLHVLKDGDKIEMVFADSETEAGQFPHFFYSACLMVE
jgi:hypothetical protein